MKEKKGIISKVKTKFSKDDDTKFLLQMALKNNTDSITNKTLQKIKSNSSLSSSINDESVGEYWATRPHTKQEKDALFNLIKSSFETISSLWELSGKDFKEFLYMTIQNSIPLYTEMSTKDISTILGLKLILTLTRKLLKLSRNNTVFNLDKKALDKIIKTLNNTKFSKFISDPNYYKIYDYDAIFRLITDIINIDFVYNQLREIIESQILQESVPLVEFDLKNKLPQSATSIYQTVASYMPSILSFDSQFSKEGDREYKKRKADPVIKRFSNNLINFYTALTEFWRVMSKDNMELIDLLRIYATEKYNLFGYTIEDLTNNSVFSSLLNKGLNSSTIMSFVVNKIFSVLISILVGYNFEMKPNQIQEGMSKQEQDVLRKKEYDRLSSMTNEQRQREIKRLEAIDRKNEFIQQDIDKITSGSLIGTGFEKFNFDKDTDVIEWLKNPNYKINLGKILGEIPFIIDNKLFSNLIRSIISRQVYDILLG